MACISALGEEAASVVRALADAGDPKSVTVLAKPVSLAVLREALRS